jgi:hypothetical protein
MSAHIDKFFVKTKNSSGIIVNNPTHLHINLSKITYVNEYMSCFSHLLIFTFTRPLVYIRLKVSFLQNRFTI